MQVWEGRGAYSGGSDTEVLTVGGGREAKLDSWRAEGKDDNDGGEARPHGEGWSDWQRMMASQETYDGDWTAGSARFAGV